MDHIVYLDTQAKELENLISGKKTMIIRGAAGRKMPHGRVNTGDVLYFIQNNGEGVIRAKALVTSTLHSEKLSEDDSSALIKMNQSHLCLSDKQIARWSGKRYLVLISVGSVEIIPSFPIDKSKFGSMDDWLPVENIQAARV